MTQTFRIDDVSVNTNSDALRAIVDLLASRGIHQIILAISPLVHDVSAERLGDRERVFPRLLSAMSDHRRLFEVARAGVPDEARALLRRYGCSLASHGLVHVDHRLLGREAQELSIVASCSLVRTKVFVPPFNHWNRDTEAVCQEHDIALVKFEDGWRHVRFNDHDPEHAWYYLHTHDVSIDYLREWLS